MKQTMTVCAQCGALNNIDISSALQKKPTCGKCKADLPLHGLVSQIKGKDLMRLVQKAKIPVVVDFWADWCGPCKMYAPQFENASLKIPDAIFVKVDTEEDPHLSQQLGIRGIPTTIVFKNGQETARQSGALNESLIRSLINR